MSFDVRFLDLSPRGRAEKELYRIGADEGGVARMRSKATALSIKACGLKSPAANILKQTMLSLGGDAAVAMGAVNCSIERSDVLILGTLKQVRALIKKLQPQPFGLKTLAGEIKQALAALDGPSAIEFEAPWGSGVLPLAQRPCVMGVLNATPDSFSDGGDHAAPAKALDRALEMLDQGADIIDVGGESTRPGAGEVPDDEELSRVLPVIEKIAAQIRAPVSIDTRKSRVAREALSAGASIINDVSGLKHDSAMAGVAATAGCPVIVMHMRGTPENMQADTRYDDLMGAVFRGLRESVEIALSAGIPKTRIIVDPGVGFGKNAEANLIMLDSVGELRSLGCAILVGASRKSFIGNTLKIENPKDRVEGSLAAAVLAVAKGANIIRAHDVKETRRVVDLAWAVKIAGEGRKRPKKDVDE